MRPRPDQRAAADVWDPHFQHPVVPLRPGHAWGAPLRPAALGLFRDREHHGHHLHLVPGDRHGSCPDGFRLHDRDLSCGTERDRPLPVSSPLPTSPFDRGVIPNSYALLERGAGVPVGMAMLSVIFSLALGLVAGLVWMARGTRGRIARLYVQVFRALTLSVDIRLV